MKNLGTITDPKDVATKEYVDNNTGTVNRASVSIPSDNTSIISIPITITDPNQLTVYQNGLILTPTIHYTATTTEITLEGYTANAGDIFTFVGTTQAGVALNAAASQVLFSDTTSDNCYGDCNTVQDALIHAAEWQPTITEIQVNNTPVTPENKVVKITVPETPEIPIKSLSLYGTNIAADESGNVNISGVVKTIKVNGTTISIDANGEVAITGLVKSLSLNGTPYTPNSTGVLTLSNIMKDNTAQTMSARLVAQNNTEYTTKQVRNIIMSTAEPTDSDGDNGDIWIVYEA